MTILTAGIIIIGDEVLSGRTKDVNSNYIANKLIKAGIQLDEISVIHDSSEVIIEKVLEFHEKYTYVFTTGGIGPTHDDITSKSIAIAFNQKYCFHSEAFKILEKYYPKGEFNLGRQKMAKMPEKASLILNPLTAAPGFVLENIYVLPGVPQIMEKMLLNVLETIKKGAPKKILTINTNLYESKIAQELGDIQKQFPECSIGSYPYFNYISKIGGVNIVISSWSLNDLNPILVIIKKMIKSFGGKYSII
ncbi:competence/damage-inducible protein A [Alphaproteobacteria bacterium]|nr:competence/damage-inducible protein A [Alphaproteobacteria bacterium]